jgi:hypothetical protein
MQHRKCKYSIVTGLTITLFLHFLFERTSNAVFGTVESYTGGTSFESDPVDGYPDGRFVISFSPSRASKASHRFQMDHGRFSTVSCSLRTFQVTTERMLFKSHEVSEETLDI